MRTSTSDEVLKDALEARWARAHDAGDGSIASPCALATSKSTTKRATSPHLSSPQATCASPTKDNQKDMILNYGTKYPQLVREIVVSSAFRV